MIKYFLSRIRHKWYVFLACRKLKVGLWQAIIHDLSRFSWIEFKAFADKYNGNINKKAYAQAWLNHQNKNPHHWEYWVFNWLPIEKSFDFYQDLVENGCLEMPEKYIREMLADMMGASKEYTKSWNIEVFLLKALDVMKLHPKSRQKLIHIAYNELDIICI